MQSYSDILWNFSFYNSIVKRFYMSAVIRFREQGRCFQDSNYESVYILFSLSCYIIHGNGMLIIPAALLTRVVIATTNHRGRCPNLMFYFKLTNSAAHLYFGPSHFFSHFRLRDEQEQINYLVQKLSVSISWLSAVQLIPVSW